MRIILLSREGNGRLEIGLYFYICSPKCGVDADHRCRVSGVFGEGADTPKAHDGVPVTANNLPLAHRDHALPRAEDDLDAVAGMLVIFLALDEDLARLQDDEFVDVIVVRPPANVLVVPFAAVAAVVVVVVPVATDAAEMNVDMNGGSTAIVIVPFPMLREACGGRKEGEEEEKRVGVHEG